MKLYIAGPMTHIPQYNVPAFDAMAEVLRGLGHEVVSPAELDDPEIRRRQLASLDGTPQTVEGFGMSWGDFLSRDVKQIADSNLDGIVILPGWERSRGARLETFVGHLCGIPTYSYHPWYGLLEQHISGMAAAWKGPA